MAFCVRCGKGLGLLRRFSDSKMCSACEEIDRQEKLAKENAERVKYQGFVNSYQGTLKEIWNGWTDLPAAETKIQALVAASNLKPGDIKPVSQISFKSFSDEVLGDDILSRDEETKLLLIAKALNIDVYTSEWRELTFRLMVAKANDGRLSELDNPRIILKKAEVAHVELSASLLKEVKIREYQGGYSGVSFRIAKGVRYHTGGSRGRSVVVGTDIQDDDTGTLTISSQRIVFLGSRKTVDLALSKIARIEVFQDGVVINASNRVNAIRMRVENGDVVGAVVNAASQKLLK